MNKYLVSGLVIALAIALVIAYPYLTPSTPTLIPTPIPTPTQTPQGLNNRLGVSIEQVGYVFTFKNKVKGYLINLITNETQEVLIDPFDSTVGSMFYPWETDKNNCIFEFGGNKITNPYNAVIDDSNFPYKREYIYYFRAPETKTYKGLSLGADYGNGAWGRTWRFIGVVGNITLQQNYAYAFKLTVFQADLSYYINNNILAWTSYAFILPYDTKFNVGYSYTWVLADNTQVTPTIAYFGLSDPDGNDCSIGGTAYNCHVQWVVHMYYSSTVSLREIWVISNGKFVTRLIFVNPLSVPANIPVVLIYDVYTT